MEFSSYAALFLANPHVMMSVKRQYGSTVYTDDNVICDPAKDPQTVATCRLVDNVLCVYDHPAEEGDEPAIECYNIQPERA